MHEAPAGGTAIIDYEMGNLFSVRQACIKAGMNPVISSDPKTILSADAAILPGVGAFGEAMSNLRKLDLIAPIRDFIDAGKPLMGVCLGLQLLFEESEEFGRHPGLGLIPGQVRRFPSGSPAAERLRIPQIGWNRIRPTHGPDSWRGTLLEGVNPGEFMYFVHSYFVTPAENSHSICLTDYEGIEYCSAVRRGNIFAVQFHPEKSAHQGLKIYRNFHELSQEKKAA